MRPFSLFARGALVLAWLAAGALAQSARVSDLRTLFFWDVNYTGAGALQNGNYTNGEAWLAIPVGETVTVVRVGRWTDPTLTVVDTAYTGPSSPAPGEYRNGTMKNPQGGGVLGPNDETVLDLNKTRTGYDSRSSLFAAGAFLAFPLTLSPGDALVSTRSNPPAPNPQVPPCTVPGTPWETVRPGWCTKSPVRNAGVLTCVGQVPPYGAFRPPYSMPFPAARNALVPLTTAMIDWSVLPRVAPHPNAAQHPRPAEVAPLFTKVWLEHVSGENMGDEVAPSDHMAGYGVPNRESISTAALVAMINPDAPLVPDGPSLVPPRNQAFLQLVYGMLQIGIDNWGLMQQHQHSFEGSGGRVGGRKFLVAFAGKMFGVHAYAGTGGEGGMRGPWTMTRVLGGVTTTVPRWKEDRQYFEAPSTATASALQRGDWDWMGSPWLFGNKRSDRGWQDLPPAQWTAEQRRTESYRICCSPPPNVGLTLALRMLGMEEVWDNRAFFGFVDRYMILEHLTAKLELLAVGIGTRSSGTYHRWPGDANAHSAQPIFTLEMWDANRWRANQAGVWMKPDSTTFVDEIDRGPALQCPEARRPVLLTQMPPRVGTDMLFEIYSNEVIWDSNQPTWVNFLIAGGYDPLGHVQGLYPQAVNREVLFVTEPTLSAEFTELNRYGYYALTLTVPNFPGAQLALQAVFLNVNVHPDCVGVSNAVAFQIVQ